MVAVIIWTVLALGAVIILFTVNGILPFIWLYLVKPFLRTKEDNQPSPAQPSPRSVTSNETKGEEEETIDNENSEEKGEENSSVMDSEDSGEE